MQVSHYWDSDRTQLQPWGVMRPIKNKPHSPSPLKNKTTTVIKHKSNAECEGGGDASVGANVW